MKIDINGGLLGLMFLIFMTLKLMGYITWSWWWVTAPLWGGVAFFTVFAILMFIVAIISEGVFRK